MSGLFEGGNTVFLHFRLVRVFDNPRMCGKFAPGRFPGVSCEESWRDLPTIPKLRSLLSSTLLDLDLGLAKGGVRGTL